MASCKNCSCNSASCRDTRQEAESHGQSLQEAIYQAQQSRQDARDHGQSRRKPNTTDSLCRKRKLADSFIPCVIYNREDLTQKRELPYMQHTGEILNGCCSELFTVGNSLKKQ